MFLEFASFYSDSSQPFLMTVRTQEKPKDSKLSAPVVNRGEWPSSYPPRLLTCNEDESGGSETRIKPEKMITTNSVPDV
ncbi:hypothetical protein J6590_018117 [Homalodisca vitripennis]|nr:hypothetical protein J6590_018117 [Homalodisca vitripennis]